MSAQTAAGGFATQTFSLLPSGTVRAEKVSIYSTSNGEVRRPADLTSTAVNAWVPDGAGGYTQLAGSGDAEGNAMVPGVPAGFYLMQVGKDYVWTDASFTVFRPGSTLRPRASAGTKVALEITNAAPFDPFDYFWWSAYPGSVNELDPALTPGATTLTATDDWYGYLVDAAQGDQSYICQMHRIDTSVISPGGNPYPLLLCSRFLGPLAITIVDGATTTVSLPLASPAMTSTFRMNIKGSAFKSVAMASHPAASLGSTAMFLETYSGPHIDLVNYLQTEGPIDSDIDFGDIHYPDPFPSVTKDVLFLQGASVTYDVPATSGTPAHQTEILSTVAVGTTTLPDAANPVAPAIGNPTSPTINGLDFFTSHDGIGSTPQLQWGPPVLGTPSIYIIYVYALTSALPTLTATVRTADTRLVLPPGVLSAAQKNVIHIVATKRPTSQPFDYDFPVALAEVFSGMIAP